MTRSLLRERVARLALWPLALATWVTVGGCTPASPDMPAIPTQSPSASSVAAVPDGAASQTPEWPTLVADDASAADAQHSAVQAMSVFARPDLPHEQWWAELEPLLSPAAVMAYRTVDPSSVPATRVTGEAALPQWDTPRIARVSVPTDAGVYLVVVSRHEADPTWRVERITPPEAR